MQSEFLSGAGGFAFRRGGSREEGEGPVNIATPIDRNAAADTATRRTVRILGTHGVPANYGGFETAAEAIARYLARGGWRVIVYCQIQGEGPITEDVWQGIERVLIPIDRPGWKGTSEFDWHSIRHASQFDDLCLTFGYNTGIFNLRQRLKKIPNIINMDGIEWSRSRWGFTEKAILYVNERFAALFGDVLIADHPEIYKYLLARAPARKITTITYGAYPLDDAPTEPVRALGLEAGGYLTLIARPVPENSLLELVEGFSARPRGCRLALLGKLDPENDSYHRAVCNTASSEVVLLGNIYDGAIVQSLRFHSLGYLHGHTVGGTNPSLVEALAAGNAIVARDNAYNRWVARDGAIYFDDVASADEKITLLLSDGEFRSRLKQASLARYREEFTWDHISRQYEEVMLKVLARR